MLGGSAASLLSGAGTAGAAVPQGLAAGRHRIGAVSSVIADALRPAIHPRSEWGADLPPTGALREEQPGDVRFLLVHHSVDSNTYRPQDVPRMIRNTYASHTGPAHRWPDVAYNFMVDRYGSIWEARAGSLAGPVMGDASGGSQGFAVLCCLMGSHHLAPPTEAAVAAMVDLLAWLGVHYGIDTRPGAETVFTSRGSNLHPAGTVLRTPTIAGHRDMSATVCPGEYLYRIVTEELPARVTRVRDDAVAAVTHADVRYTLSGRGYWVLRTDGSVDTTGDASDDSAARPRETGEWFTALIPAAGRGGHWLTTNVGRIVAVGSAPPIPDLVDLLGPGALRGDVVGASPTPDGRGLWLVGAEGGVFALGEAGFHGSVPQLQGPGEPLAGRSLAAPIVGVASSPTGHGYWLVAADGGMFSFGDAGYFGSIPQVLPPGRRLDAPVTDMIPQGNGYLLVAIDGGIFTFGQSRFHGSLGGHGQRDIVAATVLPDRSGYLILQSSGTLTAFGTSRVL